MSNELYYNRRDWIEPVLTTEILEKLDERYINSDEVINTREIELLYVKYITMIDPVGYIEFSDGSRQSTAIIDNLDKNNIFIGENTFNNLTIFNGDSKLRSLFVEDVMNNKKTKIYQQGNILVMDNNNLNSSFSIQVYNTSGLLRRYIFDSIGNISGVANILANTFQIDSKNIKLYNLNERCIIENLELGGMINFRTKTVDNVIREITIDQFSNISGLNDVNANKIKTSQLILNNSIFFTQSGQNCIFQNNNIFGEYQWKTKTGTGSDGWTLAFNPSGQFYGMNNILSHSLETKYIKFRNPSTFQLTGSQIYEENNNIIIDNANIPGLFKLRHKTSNNDQNELLINEFMNITGVNDLTMKGKLGFSNNTIIHKFENNAYVIDNINNGSTIQIKNYNNNGVLKQININENITGVNDLYVQRIFFNNVHFNFNDYINLLLRTRNIYSFNDNETSIEYNNGRFLFFPAASASTLSYNPIIKANDNALIGYNVSQINNNVLTIAAYSTSQSGIRLKNAEVELYKPKIMDSLTFSDNTTQNTAMTDAYLTSLIQNVVNNMQLQLVPVGTIMAYSGDSVAPTGYLFCQGSSVLISSYPELYGVVGNKYLYNNTIISGRFYLPDLRGAYLKGINAPMIFQNSTPMTVVGQKQEGNVGRHTHRYKDRGSGEIRVNYGNDDQIADNKTETFFLFDGNTYNSDTEALLDAENRPNSIGVYYIIKY
jgi:microcystin-dependent protein